MGPRCRAVSTSRMDKFASISKMSTFMDRTTRSYRGSKVDSERDYGPSPFGEGVSIGGLRTPRTNFVKSDLMY